MRRRLSCGSIYERCAALAIIAAWRTEYGRTISGCGSGGRFAAIWFGKVIPGAVESGSGRGTRASLLPNTVDVAERLYRETEGLPYFVVEYLRAARARRRLVAAAQRA
jgi:hypothetical protein